MAIPDIANMSTKEIQKYRNDEKVKELLKGMNDLEKLKVYYTRDDLEFELSPRVKTLDEHVNFIIRMQANGHPNTKIVNAFSKTYGLSKRVGWKKMKQAAEIFGSMSDFNSKMKFHSLETMMLNAYRRSKKKGNLKEMNAATKNLLGLYKELNKDQDIDFDKLEQALYVVALEEGIKKKLENLISQGGALNLDNFMNYVNEVSEEIEFTTAESHDGEGTDQEGD